MRQSIYLCRGMWKESIFKMKYIASFLIGFSAALSVLLPYLEATGNESIQILEPFIILLSDRSYTTFIFLGYFFIISDAPFVNSRVEQTLLRTNRRRWKNSIVLYMATQTALYYGFLFLVTVVPSIPRGYIGNIWSQSFYMMSKYGTNANIIIPEASFLAMGGPVSAAIHSVFLMFLYSFTLAMIVLVFSLGTSRLIGSICALGVHFVGYLIISDSMFIPIKYSLLAHGVYYYHSGQMTAGAMSVVFSYCLFAFIIIILLIILDRMIEYCDLRLSVSEKNI